MEKSQYDVIVVGSGPAGISAAIRCNRQGLNVLIVTLDPDGSFGGAEVVESIHPGVASLLHSLGLDNGFQRCVVGTYTSICNGTLNTSLNPYSDELWTGYHILRKSFRAMLIEAARQAGIKVINNIEVVGLIQQNGKVIGIETTSKAYYALVVIDATGWRSLAVKKLALNQHFFSPKLIVTSAHTPSVVPELAEPGVAYFLCHSHGWSWTAQLHDGTSYWTNLSIANDPRLFKPLYLTRKASPDKKYNVTANMRWRIVRPLCCDGLILCGDSAFIIDPASGQGILNAMLSGIQAGDTAVNVIGTPAMASLCLAQYDQVLSDTFRNKTSQLSKTYKELGIQFQHSGNEEEIPTFGLT